MTSLTRFICMAVFLITALPTVLALEPYGIVSVPVANLREEGRHGAELVSQGIMGTPVKIDGREGQWYDVTMPDGYRGYMIDNSLTLTDGAGLARWQESPRCVVEAMSTCVHSAPSRDSALISPLQLADILVVRDTIAGGEWLHVALPDGREGYMEQRDAREFKRFGRPGTKAAETIINRGKALMGQEYLWGGTSAKANDCSGFSRILFQSAGVYLPRDAWQQALTGSAVEEKDLRPADLIFFANAKGRVNHVGIYLGDGLMLHCSGRVRINRLWGEGDEERYRLRPSLYRRILGSAPLESDREANNLYFGK